MSENRKLVALGFGLLVILSAGLAGSVEAPKSQPSKKADLYPKLHCDEWKKDPGFEGKCTYTDKDKIEWEVSYTREGKEKRSWGKTKNLVVLFSMVGGGHKPREWWPDIVGPSKTIDPENWVILSMGPLKAKEMESAPEERLNLELFGDAYAAIITSLYGESKYIAGGPSLGAVISLYMSMHSSNRVRKLFMVARHGLPGERYDERLEYLESVVLRSIQEGAFQFWDDKKKYDFWFGYNSVFVRSSFTEAYFQNPKNMKDIGKKESDYRGSEDFKNLVAHEWTRWIPLTTNPLWLAANIRIWANFQANNSENNFKNLPKDILVVLIKQDLNNPRKTMLKFAEVLSSLGKNVTTKEIDDERGHMASSSGEAPTGIKEAISQFFAH